MKYYKTSESSSEEEYDKLWDVKELKFNLEKLVNMSRDEILKHERERKTAEDQKYNYGSGCAKNIFRLFFENIAEIGKETVYQYLFDWFGFDL